MTCIGCRSDAGRGFRTALRGGYWTLDKRAGDLDAMEGEWNKLLAAFPGDPTLEINRTLAARLRAAAPAVRPYCLFIFPSTTDCAFSSNQRTVPEIT